MAEKVLIVNADDFGLHPAINEGIILALREGIVTDTSIVACGSAFEDAVSRLRLIGKYDVGVHLTIVGEKPLSSPDEIPTIVNRSEGKFFAGYRDFLLRYLLGKVDIEDVKKEFHLQIKRVVDARLHVTHLDTHQHIHLLPKIGDVVVSLAVRNGVSYVRYPVPDERLPFNLRGMVFRLSRFLGGHLLKKLRESDICFADHFLGVAYGGKLNKGNLLMLLKGLPGGITEVMCHPGLVREGVDKVYPWGYLWEKEFEALTDADIKSYIFREGIRLSGVKGVACR
ncbi:MAG: ChbG/HpnK family deacetylase [Synergistetes bacterium]|nr:ChbG/HpnK family deacetylase [Synergistota bacterium]